MSLQPTDLLIIQRGDKSYKMAASELPPFIDAPTVGDGTITIVQPGTDDQTFTVNQDGDTVITLKNDNTFIEAGLGLVPNGQQIDVGQGTGINVTNDSVGIADGGVGTTQLADGSVTKDKIDAVAGGARKFLQINSTNTALQWSIIETPDIPTVVPAGTLMLFQQTMAPTGWTKSTAHNNKALRVVSGTASFGGNTDFTTVFQARTPTGTVSGSVDGGYVGYTTLAASQIASHNHSLAQYTSDNYHNTNLTAHSYAFNQWSTQNISASGGSGSHTHGLYAGALNASLTMDSMDFAVQYVDIIIASKD